MNKKEFEKLVGYKVTDGYYNDAVRAFGLANGMTPEAFASEWAAGADSSELVRSIVNNAGDLKDIVRDQALRLLEAGDVARSSDALLKQATLERDIAQNSNADAMAEVKKWREEAVKHLDRAEAAEAALAKVAQTQPKHDEQAAAVKSRAERAEADAEAVREELARWRSAAEGMKRRMQTMIETEIIKTGWRAVNFQPCALLLQLLREELPEFDVIEYLKQLSDKYNR